MTAYKEPLIERLQVCIRFSVRILAILMTFVILMGVVDVAWTIYQKLATPPLMIVTVNDMLATFGAFMAVLIAIEIFINITIYLREDVIHVKIVMATALMAVSRKIIILDLNTTDPLHVYGLAALLFALGIGYWLIRQLPSFHLIEQHGDMENHLAPPIDAAVKPKPESSS